MINEVNYFSENGSFHQFKNYIKRRNDGFIILPVLFVLLCIGLIFLENVLSRLGVVILLGTLLFISKDLIRLKSKFSLLENIFIIDSKKKFILKGYLLEEKKFHINLFYYVGLLLGIMLTISGYKEELKFGDLLLFTVVFSLSYFHNKNIINQTINPILKELDL
jgi:hypothetical protein